MVRKNKLMQAAMRLRAMPVPAGAAGIAADLPTGRQVAHSGLLYHTAAGPQPPAARTRSG